MACTQQFCTFLLGDHLFGIEVEKVQEIIRQGEITPVPLAPRAVRGLINLRGEIVAVIDLRARLDLGAGPSGADYMNVVVRSPHGPVSLLVDEIGDVIEVDESTFQRPPETLRGVARDLIRGAHKLEGRLLLVLETEKAADPRSLIDAGGRGGAEPYRACPRGN